MSWFHIFLTQESKPYRQGEVIFERDQQADCMYVIAEGEVEIVVNGQGVDVLRREAIFGEMALIAREPRAPPLGLHRLPPHRDRRAAVSPPGARDAGFRARGDARFGEEAASERPDAVSSRGARDSLDGVMVGRATLSGSSQLAALAARMAPVARTSPSRPRRRCDRDR
jgi:hypothetical protein